jgi:phage terminase large subunit
MITKEIYVTDVYEWIRKSKARINIIKGGAGSSKSYSLAQHFIFNKMLSGTDLVNVVIRKTLPSLRKTALKLILDLLEKYGVPYKFNKSELELKVSNSITYFMSLDEPEKIKSLDINNAWLEEATELNLEDLRQIRLRLRRENKEDINQIYLSFNPVSALHFIKTELVDKADEDIAVHTSTYKDNPFLSREYIKDIEDLINQDLNFYKIYALGEWGVLENIIYSGWQVVEEPEKFDDVTFGVDWAFNTPSAILKCYWIDGKFIWQELFYGGGLTQDQLVEKALKLIPAELRRKDLYVDAAEPALIQALFNRGFNAKRAKKDVQDGISYVKTHLTGIVKGSDNLLKEIQSYSWKQDKDNNVLEDPVKFNDHLMDAGRYASYSAYRMYPQSRTLEHLSFR